MQIRTAVPADLETIVALRAERATWLAQRGSDQWSEVGLSHDGFHDRVAASISAGQTWMISTDDLTRDLGTIAVDHISDPGLWDDADLDDAVIAHRMIVSLAAAGQGVGALLLQIAEDQARLEGRHWVRLDAWTTNHDLHKLYLRHGFRHVRTVIGHGPSAALFERPVAAPPRAPSTTSPPGLPGGDVAV